MRINSFPNNHIASTCGQKKDKNDFTIMNNNELFLCLHVVLHHFSILWKIEVNVDGAH